MTSKHGLHSKLTGAGGGGCAFTLVTPGNLKGQNRVNYVTVIKVHCTVGGGGGGNSLMKGKGMFIVCLGYSVRRHPLPS